jgi:hypothetical protein
MKSLKFSLLILLVSIAPAFAQSDEHKHGAAAAPQADAQKPAAGAAQAPKSEAQLSFAELKSLAGVWEGHMVVNPPLPQMGDALMRVTLRVTSRGNAIVHEMSDPAKPDDPTKYDHPVTMIYREGDHLSLVHYCDAGNRPRMSGKLTPDGKAVEFDFVELSGSNNFGHMHHAVFTPIDENHHIEEWTYMMPGDKPMRARAELRRVTPTTASAK